MNRAAIVEDAHAAAVALDQFCMGSGTLADYERPRRHAFVTELPYTATGKKQHFKMKDQSPADDAAGVFVRP